ncbi:MAG: hypothetical protein WAK82_36230 [Streptosporangiaceae bacterium]
MAGYSQPYQAARRAPSGPLPSSLSTAVRLMYAGAGYALVWAIGTIAVAASAAQNQPILAGTTDFRLGAVVSIVVLLTVVEITLWLVIARGCRRGQSGARMTGTVLFGLHTLGVLDLLRAGSGLGGVKVLAVLGWLIACAAVVFLWQRRSSEFFQGQRPSGR